MNKPLIELEENQINTWIPGGSLGGIIGIAILSIIGVAIYELDRIADNIEEVYYKIKKTITGKDENGNDVEEEIEETISREVECLECIDCDGDGKITSNCRECMGEGYFTDECDYDGCEDGDVEVKCEQCDGEGEVDRVKCNHCDEGKIKFHCPQCKGTEKYDRDCEYCENGKTTQECGNCEGTGYVSNEDEIENIRSELESMSDEEIEV